MRSKNILNLVKHGMNGHTSWAEGLVCSGGGEVTCMDADSAAYIVPGVYSKKEVKLANNILKITKLGVNK